MMTGRRFLPPSARCPGRAAPASTKAPKARANTRSLVVSSRTRRTTPPRAYRADHPFEGLIEPVQLVACTCVRFEHGRQPVERRDELVPGHDLLPTAFQFRRNLKPALLLG